MIVGVDEAGVGCMAGPLVMVSAAFPRNAQFPELVRDSKTLTEEQREDLVDQIYNLSSWVMIKTASPDFINSLGGIWSVWEKMLKEILASAEALTMGKASVTVDGDRRVPGFAGVIYEPKADKKYKEVSAASIIAKYVQTAAMEDLHDRLPQYLFNTHHGYCTATHQRLLEEHGPTKFHRFSYRPVESVIRKLSKMKRRQLMQLELFDRPTIVTKLVHRV